MLHDQLHDEVGTNAMHAIIMETLCAVAAGEIEGDGYGAADD